MILKGKIVTLRPIEQDDLEFMLEIINDPDTERTIVGWSLPLSRKDEENWYAGFRNNDTTIRYIIETEEDGRVGFTGITNIDWKNGSAKGCGIRVTSKKRTKGIATDAYMTMLRYAFYELRLHRVVGSALSTNAASLRFMEKCGYKREGVLRESVFKQGKYHDVVTVAVLKSDYEKVVKETNYWGGNTNAELITNVNSGEAVRKPFDA